MTLPYDIITFDCYGTLIDWRQGIGSAVTDAARRAGRELDPEYVLELHARFEAEIQRGLFRRYRDVLTEVMIRLACEIDWSLSEEDAGFLAESIPSWEPFQDTNEVLRTLKTDGYRLGILSNVDNDLLAGTRRRFGVEFDLLVTAEDVRAYKPSAEHFHQARRLIGGNRWLHVAQSYFHDIRPASEMGVATVWINRLDEDLPGDPAPVANVPDLHGLVDWLAAVPPRRARPGQEPRDSMS